jgi:hypothetical protein
VDHQPTSSGFRLFDKGPSINDVSLEGEGGGTPQKEMKGDIGRDPVFSRGDVFFKTPKSS